MIPSYMSTVIVLPYTHTQAVCAANSVMSSMVMPALLCSIAQLQLVGKYVWLCLWLDSYTELGIIGVMPTYVLRLCN